MAEWVTHLMIADALLQHLPQLHRRGFCVGSIAPDCNVENADWTAFMPPREVIHWTGVFPQPTPDLRLIAVTAEEYASFVTDTIALITDAFRQDRLLDAPLIKKRACGHSPCCDAHRRVFYLHCFCTDQKLRLISYLE